MLVYDITNSKSFDNIAKWLRNIQEHANEDVEKMILGNKCDMEDKRVIPKGCSIVFSQKFLSFSERATSYAFHTILTLTLPPPST